MKKLFFAALTMSVLIGCGDDNDGDTVSIGTVTVVNNSHSRIIRTIGIVDVTKPEPINIKDWAVFDFNTTNSVPLIDCGNSKSYELPAGMYVVAVVDEYGDNFQTVVLFKLSAGQTRTISYDGVDDLAVRSEKTKQNSKLLESSDYLQIIKDKIANGETKLLKVE